MSISMIRSLLLTLRNVPLNALYSMSNIRIMYNRASRTCFTARAVVLGSPITELVIQNDFGICRFVRRLTEGSPEVGCFRPQGTIILRPLAPFQDALCEVRADSHVEYPPTFAVHRPPVPLPQQSTIHNSWPTPSLTTHPYSYE